MLEADIVSSHQNADAAPASPPRRGRFSRLRPASTFSLAALSSSPFLRFYLALVTFCVVLDVLAPGFSRRNSHPALYAPSEGPSIGNCLSRGLMENRHASMPVKHVVDDYDCGCKRPEVYEPHENPRVAAIVQSYNHRRNIAAIASALVDNPAVEEIIICEDGSSDQSLEEWMYRLQGLQHFVVVSNNLHEVRCYNRAMRMSSAEFFILLQDDDIPGGNTVPHAEAAARVKADAVGRGEPVPADDQLPVRNWVADALDLMDAHEKLGVLSGFIGQMWDGDKGYEFGEQQSDHGGTRKGPTRRVPFISTSTLRPFMYVECAWIAPVIVRASVLRRVGGLDVDVFRAGEPGVWQDCLLSYAAWSAGWRVGVYDAMFKRGVGGHGSTSTKEKTKMRGKMWAKAKKVVDERFERKFIKEHVLQLNNQTLNWRYVPV